LTRETSFDEGSEQSICHIVSNSTPVAMKIEEIAKHSAEHEEISAAVLVLRLTIGKQVF